MNPVMKTRQVVALSFVVALLSIGALRVQAQLAAPGPSGVAMGHLHLTARDAAATRAFWTALGGVAVQNGTLQLQQFPGTFVMVRQGQPAAGTSGSTVDHVTWKVKDLKQSVDRWSKDAAIVVSSSGVVTGPDGVMVRLIEDPSIDAAIRLDSISIVTVAPEETQAWYVKQFGATPAKSGATLTGKLPGVTLEFSKAEAAPAGTRGRALDHIGFEVRNLEEFCKKLEAAGLKLDRPYTKLPNSTTAIAFLTDPWGTYIELTENLAPAK
jgi:catechol 2,3-dioxygenase-like lactoylglutathione lyase family enzyme